MRKGQADVLDRLENAELKGKDRHEVDPHEEKEKQELREVPKVKPRGGGALDFMGKMTAEECFLEFDTDKSGLIDYEEFQQMLPRLGIDISEAKALRYFRMCDKDNSGAIDLDEFKVRAEGQREWWCSRGMMCALCTHGLQAAQGGRRATNVRPATPLPGFSALLWQKRKRRATCSIVSLALLSNYDYIFPGC